MQSDKELYFFIFTIKILDKSSINNIELNEQLFKIQNGEIKTLRLYKSFRTESDYIIWGTSDNPENFVILKNQINALSGKYSINLVNSYLSIYERSPDHQYRMNKWCMKVCPCCFHLSLRLECAHP